MKKIFTLDHSIDSNSISTACFHFILATVGFLICHD